MRVSRGLSGSLCFVLVLFGSISLFGGKLLPNPLLAPDSRGVLGTYSTAGGIDINNPFFQNLGSNGRTCNTCHISSSAWTITPADVRAKFNATQGLDPIFRTNDGSNCPSADVSTVSSRRQAYSQLLSKALIRVSVSVPANAEFQIVLAVDLRVVIHEDPHVVPSEIRKPCIDIELRGVRYARECRVGYQPVRVGGRKKLRDVQVQIRAPVLGETVFRKRPFPLNTAIDSEGHFVDARRAEGVD